MRTIRISDEVWEEIAARGKFGETDDDVLRRVFDIKEYSKSPKDAENYQPIRIVSPRRFIRGPRKAERRLSPRIVGRKFEVRFPDDGIYRTWDLHAKDDKNGIRKMLNEALDFGGQNGATEGQLKHIRKALNESGYYLYGPRRPRIRLKPLNE